MVPSQHAWWTTPGIQYRSLSSSEYKAGALVCRLISGSLAPNPVAGREQVLGGFCDHDP